VRGGYAYGRYWAERVAAFHEVCDKVGGMLVRYEDFIRDEALWKRVEDYLELAMNRDTLNQAADPRYGQAYAACSRADMLMLRWAVSPLAARLGYELDGSSAAGSRPPEHA
jgi:hypothetical protein